MPAATPAGQFTAFLSKYEPALRRDARASLARLRRHLPGAVELVYDNYNALVVGFGPSERASEAIVSLAFFPRWVTLCFLQYGPRLTDPQRMLRGSGSVVRNVRLAGPAAIDSPGVRALIKAAHRLANRQIDPGARCRMVIKSISAKQRPRRPV